MTTGLIGVTPTPIVLDDFEIASLSAAAGAGNILVKSNLDLEGNDLLRVGDLAVLSISGLTEDTPVEFHSGLSLDRNDLTGLDHVYGSGSFQGFTPYINVHSPINMEGENITHIGGIAIRGMEYNPFDDQVGTHISLSSALDGGDAQYVRGRIRIRRFIQSSRPTLLDSEVAYWGKSSSERYLLYRGGGFYVRTPNMTFA